MTVRWLIDLVLLLLVLGLGLLVRHEVERANTLPQLSALDPAGVRLVEIGRPGGTTIRLGATPSGWRMEQPLKADVDQSQVATLTAILTTPVHRGFPAATAALGELGLAPPRIRLRLDSLELGVGDLDPIAQYRYVASGGLVQLIDDRFYHLLIAQPLDWLSRRPLPRGFTPVFGRLDGTPLASEALIDLAALVAERLEPLSGESSGSSLEIEGRDGTPLHFRLSEDRLRWTAPDLRAVYVLRSAPTLALDPTAVDPTPHPAASATVSPNPGELGSPAPLALPEPEPATEEPPVVDRNDPFAPPPESELPAEPSNPDDVILPGDAELGPPPSVHLGPDGPDGRASAGDRAPRHRPRASGHPRGGSDPGLPQGFGQDPFAPDPDPGTADTAPR